MNNIVKFSWVFILGGCTHASISSIPLEIEGVGTVYRYQGRANFPHQIAEADRRIAEDCKQKNGGKPVIVDLKKKYLGQVDMGGGESRTRINATVTGTGNYSQVTGTARNGKAQRDHELREAVLGAVTDSPDITRGRLRELLGVKNERLGRVLDDLTSDGVVERTAQGWRIARHDDQLETVPRSPAKG